MDGVTHYAGADFTDAECGCTDMSVSRDVDEGDSNHDDDPLDSVEISIIVAAAAAVLLLLCACGMFRQRRKMAAGVCYCGIVALQSCSFSRWFYVVGVVCMPDRPEVAPVLNRS